jgi:hypothetical protein
MRLRGLALFGGLILLLLPAAASAQSAGDKQYSDPFANQSPSSGNGNGNGNGSSSPTAQAPNNSQSTGSGSQAASDPSSNSTASGSSSSSASGSLPRTGLRAWVLAAMGALMLLAGALLRFVARPVRVRAGSLSPPVLGRDVRLRRTHR